MALPTPQPATPAALLGVIRELASRLPATRQRVGIAFPSVVKNGITHTAANIDKAWIGAAAAALAARELARPVLFLNDADAAGLAEMRWGAGRDCTGTVIMLTFGTGIGTALFTGGQLFPNTELGHLELHGVDAEKRASAQARTLEQLDFPAWVERVNEYLAAMHRLFWPDVFILGGAVSERFAEFAPLLRSQAELRAAHFANQAGVIGAALAAADERF
jgi:polyphosphate glucokinase